MESRILEYGEDGVPTWDVGSFTYFRIPGHFGQKKKSPAAQRGECDKFLVCDEKQMVLDGVGSMGMVEGGQRGPRIRFYFRIPEN